MLLPFLDPASRRCKLSRCALTVAMPAMRRTLRSSTSGATRRSRRGARMRMSRVSPVARLGGSAERHRYRFLSYRSQRFEADCHDRPPASAGPSCGRRPGFCGRHIDVGGGRERLVVGRACRDALVMASLLLPLSPTLSGGESGATAESYGSMTHPAPQPITRSLSVTVRIALPKTTPCRL
jgi:hypothetical protein